MKNGFPGHSVVKNLPASAGDVHLIPGLGISPGEGNGTPLQCSGLGNRMDRGAWWAAIYGVAQSRTQLKQLSSKKTVAQTVKHLPTMQETWFQSLAGEDPLEKEMATHSSILAWKNQWTEEPRGLQSLGSQSQIELSN